MRLSTERGAAAEHHSPAKQGSANVDRNRMIERLESAIEAQKRFVYTVPDPDNRELAEANLMALIFKRDMFVENNDRALTAVVVR